MNNKITSIMTKSLCCKFGHPGDLCVWVDNHIFEAGVLLRLIRQVLNELVDEIVQEIPLSVEIPFRVQRRERLPLSTFSHSTLHT